MFEGKVEWRCGYTPFLTGHYTRASLPPAIERSLRIENTRLRGLQSCFGPTAEEVRIFPLLDSKQQCLVCPASTTVSQYTEGAALPLIG